MRRQGGAESIGLCPAVELEWKSDGYSSSENTRIVACSRTDEGDECVTCIGKEVRESYVLETGAQCSVGLVGVGSMRWRPSTRVSVVKLVFHAEADKLIRVLQEGQEWEGAPAFDRIIFQGTQSWEDELAEKKMERFPELNNAQLAHVVHMSTVLQSGTLPQEVERYLGEHGDITSSEREMTQMRSMQRELGWVGSCGQHQASSNSKNWPRTNNGRKQLGGARCTSALDSVIS
ncbi:hypothetical protein C8R44DRAFT_746214 [Mycena epipterygia]|nr:hypothetical protein C8R44DRAFT_746214 [Mycena epipterygia]